MLLDARRCSLLLVDVQERLLPAMCEPDRVVKHCGILLEAAHTLAVPVTVSEQYPKGLGHTLPALQPQLGNAALFAKSSFSCWRDDALRQHLTLLHEAERPQVIVAGIEAHVCVLQTAIQLQMAGFLAYVVADATSSRQPQSHALALQRLVQQGIQVISTEMAVFELLGAAGTPEFKSLSALIK